jgi:hypothetical protein
MTEAGITRTAGTEQDKDRAMGRDITVDRTQLTQLWDKLRKTSAIIKRAQIAIIDSVELLKRLDGH